MTTKKKKVELSKEYVKMVSDASIYQIVRGENGVLSDIDIKNAELEFLRIRKQELITQYNRRFKYVVNQLAKQSGVKSETVARLVCELAWINNTSGPDIINALYVLRNSEVFDKVIKL